MPATLGGQWTIIATFLIGFAALIKAVQYITNIAKKGLQWLELVTKTILWAQGLQGKDVPGWLADEYKKVNGNSKASKEEITDLLGEKHAPK